jgi:hypothetical protein
MPRAMVRFALKAARANVPSPARSR